jgi:hypothetical protein
VRGLLIIDSRCPLASFVEYVSAPLSMPEHIDYQPGTRTLVASCCKALCRRVVALRSGLDPNDASSAIGSGAARAVQGHGTAPVTVLPALVYPVVDATIVGAVR